jgi:methionine synthase II (cobalamin-independent)
LPKPAWLAKPRMLWAPWQLEGEALVEAKRDATLLVLKEQEDAGIDIVTAIPTCCARRYRWRSRKDPPSA